MNIIIDAHGGDNAPLEAIKGARMAADEYRGVTITLCGIESQIKDMAQQHNIPLEGLRIAPCELVMPMDGEPAEILKTYVNSSMAVGLKMLAVGEGDAFVSAGSTGALTVGSSLIVKRIKGIKRAALGIVIPTTGGCYMLIDGGANAECRPEMLQQFGIMGSAYMQKVIGLHSPRVGIVNIGTEENKGTDLQIGAAKLLKKSPVNFIGNIEAREIPLGGCDVAVCDGFTGNIILKLTEGMAKWIAVELKGILRKNLATKVAAAIIKDGVLGFRNKMDYTEYGGAPLMGIAKPVIKAHGSSNATAFKNAVRQANTMAENGMIELITEAMSSVK